MGWESRAQPNCSGKFQTVNAVCRDVSALWGEQEHDHRKRVNEWSWLCADKSLFTKIFIHRNSLWPTGCCALTPGRVLTPGW